MASPFMFSFTPDAAPTFTTWTAVFQYIWKIDAEIGALNRDISAQNDRLPAGWVNQRNDWWIRWQQFRDLQMQFTTWSTQLPGDMWDAAGHWQSENEVWREQFKKLGGVPVGPEPQKRPEGPDVSGAVKWGAAAVLAGVAAYGIYMFAGPRRK